MRPATSRHPSCAFWAVSTNMFTHNRETTFIYSMLQDKLMISSAHTRKGVTTMSKSYATSLSGSVIE